MVGIIYPPFVFDPSAAGIVAYLESVHARLASHKGMISLRQLQSQTQEELDALLLSVLRPSGGAFKGEL
jgi:hypothetical protein